MDNAMVCFLSKLGHNITECSNDLPDCCFLFWQITVQIQHFNSILYYKTFSSKDGIDT